MTTATTDVQRTDANTIAALYCPHEHQRRMHGDAARFCAVVAGRRGGKTLASSAEVVTRIYRTLSEDLDRRQVGHESMRAPIFLRTPRRSYWVVGPHYRLVEQARRCLFDAVPRSAWALVAAGKHAGWSAQDRTLWLYPDISIAFRTADDPLQLVSEGLDGVWLTEAARLKDSVWPILRPALADRAGWAVADTTPLGQNWFYDEFWQRAQSSEPGYSAHHWNTEDNPHIPREEIDRLKRELPGRYYEREMLASFDAWHGRIYDEFLPATHVTRGPAPLGGSFRRVVCGVDFGMVSPTAMVVVGIGADDRRTVVHEEYHAGRSLSSCVETARQVRATYGVSMFWCDPSAAGLLMDMRNAGLPAQSADNDVLAGIQSVATALHTVGGAPMLTAHASCSNLIRELLSYRWREHRQHGTMEEPADGQSDHAVDALRYALHSEGQSDPYRGALSRR